MMGNVYATTRDAMTYKDGDIRANHALFNYNGASSLAKTPLVYYGQNRSLGFLFVRCHHDAFTSSKATRLDHKRRVIRLHVAAIVRG